MTRENQELASNSTNESRDENITLSNEILTDRYSQSDISQAPILSPEKLEEFTSGKTFEDTMVFETSGTTGKAKRVPYSKEAIETQKRRTAESFRIAGLTEEDFLMSLCAPTTPHNHMSGWRCRSGMKTLGGDVANRSFKDYEKVIENGNAKYVTAIMGVPQVVQQIGKEIEEKFGPVKQLFPNLRIGILGGDLLTKDLREQLKSRWGLQETRNCYAATEVGVVAIAADESNILTPIDDLKLEIITEDSNEHRVDPIDIQELEQKTTGSILISDLNRSVLPIIRYQINDLVRIYPNHPGGRLEVIGRKDGIMNLGGALLYPSQINAALRDTYKRKTLNWVAIVSRPNKNRPAIDIFITNESIHSKPDKIRHNIFERNKPVKEAYSVGMIEHISIHFSSMSDIESTLHSFNLEDDLREVNAGKIGFDRSYFGRSR